VCPNGTADEGADELEHGPHQEKSVWPGGCAMCYGTHRERELANPYLGRSVRESCVASVVRPPVFLESREHGESGDGNGRLQETLDFLLYVQNPDLF
jgi:hypothetical protein